MKARSGGRWGCAVLLAALAFPAWSGGGGADPRPIGPEWVPVPGERLDRMRGGFELPSGMPVSFGIERVAYVNGALVANAALTIPDVGRMTLEQARALRDIRGPLVIQLGGGNHFDVSLGLAGGTLIQNTLDGQHVQALTRINVGVGTLGLFQDLNSLSALQNALLAGGP